MKSEAEWSQDIINITMIINDEYPELSKYLKEMPSNISKEDEEGINIKNLEEYYNSLAEVIKDYSKTHTGKNAKSDTKKPEFPGYPLYPPVEDIYNNGKIEIEINPNDLSKNKALNEEEGAMNEKDFKDDMSGNDLDVPGSELDDQQESVGSEDEENNYYSLGGDGHTDLEEDHG